MRNQRDELQEKNREQKKKLLSFAQNSVIGKKIHKNRQGWFNMEDNNDLESTIQNMTVDAMSRALQEGATDWANERKTWEADMEAAQHEAKEMEIKLTGLKEENKHLHENYDKVLEMHKHLQQDHKIAYSQKQKIQDEMDQLTHKHETEIDEAEDEIETLEDQKNMLNVALSNTTQNLEAIYKSFTEQFTIERRAHEALTHDHSALAEQFEALQKQHETTFNSQAGVTERLTELERELKEVSEKRDELQEKLDLNSQQYNDTTSSLSTLKEDHSSLVEEKRALEAKLTELTRVHTGMTEEKNQLKQDLEDTKMKLFAINIQLDEIRKQAESSKQVAEERLVVVTQFEEFKKGKARDDEAHASLLDDFNKLQESFNNDTRDTELTKSLESQVQELTEQVVSLTAAKDAAQEQVLKLNDKHESISAEHAMSMSQLADHKMHLFKTEVHLEEARRQAAMVDKSVEEKQALAQQLESLRTQHAIDSAELKRVVNEFYKLQTKYEKLQETHADYRESQIKSTHTPDPSGNELVSLKAQLTLLSNQKISTDKEILVLNLKLSELERESERVHKDLENMTTEKIRAEVYIYIYVYIYRARERTRE